MEEKVFDIYDYVANALTGYTFTEKQIKYIVEDRGLINVTSSSEISRRDKNLVIADLLFIIYTSPSSSGQITRQHGDYSVTIGSTQITDKDDIYKLLMAIHSNPDEELSVILSSAQGGASWINEID
jgi:hypothetical protein